MNYKDINDYELIYLIKENDDDALELILKKYTPLISKISSKFYKKYKNLGISYEDIVQEARIYFLKALQSYNQDNDTLFYSYVLLCVERHLLTYCKAYNSSKNYCLNHNIIVDNLDNIISLNDNLASDILINNDFFLEFKNNLKFQFSIVFELKYNNFSNKEISVLLDLPITTVNGRVSIIRKKIESNLKFVF